MLRGCAVFFGERGCADKAAQECTQSVVDHVVDFAVAQVQTELRPLNGGAHGQQDSGCQQAAQHSGPLPGQKGGKNQTRRIKQRHIHEIAPQNFRISAVHHFPVGMEGEEMMGNGRGTGTVAHGDVNHQHGPDRQYRPPQEIPFRPLFPEEKEAGEAQEQQRQIRHVHSVDPKEKRQ